MPPTQILCCGILLSVTFCTIWGQTNKTVSGCECVPFYLCINATITPFREIVDIRIGTSKRCSSYIEYCCDKEDLLLKPQSHSPPPPETRGCGYHNPHGLGYNMTRNVSHEAQFGEFPWMVAIFHKGRTDLKHFFKCGGSLIHPSIVLTAAHCVLDHGSYKIRAGEWDHQSIEEIFRHEDRTVVSASLHPRFSSRNLQNDIALLFLQTPLDLVAHINVICLPPHGVVINSNSCFVHGWGKQQGDTTVLKKIKVPVVARDQCQRNFRRTRLGARFRLHRSLMCAGGEEGRDSCKGDGGGPLVCPVVGQKGRYQQVGIVSWGIGCGGKDVPGAYADVAYLRYWIDQILIKKNITLVGQHSLS